MDHFEVRERLRFQQLLPMPEHHLSVTLSGPNTFRRLSDFLVCKSQGLQTSRARRSDIPRVAAEPTAPIGLPAD